MLTTCAYLTIIGWGKKNLASHTGCEGSATSLSKVQTLSEPILFDHKSESISNPSFYYPSLFPFFLPQNSDVRQTRSPLGRVRRFGPRGDD